MKKAFTLAEVLIVLGVIGIIAAMTLPSLIARYKERELVNHWFKFNSMLQQAIMLAEQEYGDHTTWKWETYTSKPADTTGTAYDILKHYLKVASDCPTGDGGCFTQKYHYYKWLTGEGTNICYNSGPSITLLSGESICFGKGSPHFTVDLNGAAPPNKVGVDVHYFSFVDLPESKFYPGFNWGWLDFTDNAEYCNIESSSWVSGPSCGFWIQRYKNMDYLRMSKAEVRAKWKLKK